MENNTNSAVLDNISDATKVYDLRQDDPTIVNGDFEGEEPNAILLMFNEIDPAKYTFGSFAFTTPEKAQAMLQQLNAGYAQSDSGIDDDDSMDEFGDESEETEDEDNSDFTGDEQADSTPLWRIEETTVGECKSKLVAGIQHDGFQCGHVVLDPEFDANGCHIPNSGTLIPVSA